jgi:HEPN domain-containing protein
MRRLEDPELSAWVAKAAEDLRAASVLAEHAPHLESIISFHCQQAAEKYLKALFVALDREPPRTHDLDGLVGALLPDFEILAPVRDAATFLKAFAVLPRYPVFLDPGLPAGAQSTRARQAAAAIEQAVSSILASATA